MRKGLSSLLPFVCLIGIFSCAEIDAPGSVQEREAVLWTNGVLRDRWWGHNLGVVSNNPRLGSIGTVRLQDPVRGERPVLAYTANGRADIEGYVGGVVFHSYPAPNPNASAYYRFGHVQFDIRLGEGFDEGTNTISVNYGDGAQGNCESPRLKGLSKAAFTHVSVALGSFELSHVSEPRPGERFDCDRTSSVNYLSITCSKKSGASGVMYYLDNVKWTMD